MDVPAAAHEHAPVPKPKRNRPVQWVMCHLCGFPIAPLAIVAGWLVIRVGGVTVDQGSSMLDCPECGAHRRYEPSRVEPPPVAGATKQVARPRAS